MDTTAEETLLRQWEPLVRRLASRCGSAAEREDLEQVARIALWQAARRFDPARGSSFITFAIPTIRGALLRHRRDRIGAVRIPRQWWELRPRVQRQAAAVAQEIGREPTAAELADRLGVSEEDVTGALAVPDLCHPESLDGPLETPSGEETESLAGMIGAPDPLLESLELRVAVRQAVERLPAPLRAVIEHRYFLGMSQSAVGARLGISQGRVSRRERQGLACLRQELHVAMMA